MPCSRRNRAESLAPALVALLVGAVSLAVVPSCDEPDPGSAILRIVREAEISHSYRGSKRMAFGARGANAREFLVTHFAARDGVIGPTITETVGADPERSRRRVDWRSRHDYWLADVDRLLANYRILANGPAEVAGRAGTRYVVRSRHEGHARPSLEVVVDERTGLMLSYREFDWRGEPAFLAEFTSLVVDPVSLPDRPVREPREDPPSAAEEEDPPLAFARLAPRFLPEGFAQKEPGRRAGRSRTGWRVVYSDGLSWFEIRQWCAAETERAKKAEEPGVLRRHVKGSRVWMRMTHEGISVSLYGRLDPAELESVLRSLAPAD